MSLDFLTATGCLCCGYPLVEEGQICLPCMTQPPKHDGVRAAVAYGDIARMVALRFKHGRRTGLSQLIADAMLRLVTDPDALIVPVPLHRWRIWTRGFNQSALIARRLATRSGNMVSVDVLRRTRATPLLRGLGAKARAQAVKGVFAVDSGQQGLIAGRNIYLVDDVYTSGATTNACAAQLKKSGAGQVVVLCWARVLREEIDQH